MATPFETIDQMPAFRYMGKLRCRGIYQPYWGIRDSQANEVFAERLMALDAKQGKEPFSSL